MAMAIHSGQPKALEPLTLWDWKPFWLESKITIPLGMEMSVQKVFMT